MRKGTRVTGTLNGEHFTGTVRRASLKGEYRYVVVDFDSPIRNHDDQSMNVLPTVASAAFRNSDLDMLTTVRK